jgi:hypothetical protein
MNTVNSTKYILRPSASLALAASIVITGVLPGAGAASAQQVGFAVPAFLRVWERTDRPVAEGRVSRTWLWGPSPGVSLEEPFREGPGGKHRVQYFDKARMEVNDPRADPAGPYYVTNGLLVVEMISGQMQTGVSQFETAGPNVEQVAGDPGSDAPSYAALSNVASVGTAPQHQAEPVRPGFVLPTLYINRAGAVQRNLAPPIVPPGTPLDAYTMKSAGYFPETGHNVAEVFWTYMQSRGPVYEKGAYSNAQLMNWVSVMGYPITEPYWTTISVAGGKRLVLFQAFQRRILTYSPGNPEGWKVEMGNVGAQYYNWRYGQPPVPVVCERVPLRGFGRVWAGNPSVQRGVGCPLPYPPFDKELPIQTAHQRFEHGTMLWISRTTYLRETLIYVFFADGTFQQFEDTWREGQPVSGGESPPRGRYEPQRGFGKVWREGTGARVRERLGWALAPEAGGPGAYQRFERGEMYWTDTVDNVYVLYGPVDGSPYPPPTPVAGAAPYKYEVFADTFGP